MVKLLHSLNHALVQRAVFRFDPVLPVYENYPKKKILMLQKLKMT